MICARRDFKLGTHQFDHAVDIGDIDAARENLMHDNLATTELYARKRRDQIKSRIQNMVNPSMDSRENPDLHAKISSVEEKWIYYTSY